MRMRPCKISFRESAGFTLLEMMITVMIIGLLASIAIPSFKKVRETVRTKQAEHDLAILAAAIDRLAWDTGQWPGVSSSGYQVQLRTVKTANLEEVEDLASSYAGLCSNVRTNFPASKWKGPYIASNAIPLDPWGKKYFFDPDYYPPPGFSHRYVVVGSYGPNRQGRNLFDSDDITYVIEKAY